ncbi:hypothetical protein B0H13DRAFT_1880324 [Mycena leptocephala]|nr:hypothetical protein B0H13DRAFT_1880324 [Mycena leptocephala]
MDNILAVWGSPSSETLQKKGITNVREGSSLIGGLLPILVNFANQDSAVKWGKRSAKYQIHCCRRSCTRKKQSDAPPDRARARVDHGSTGREMVGTPSQRRSFGTDSKRQNARNLRSESQKASASDIRKIRVFRRAKTAPGTEQSSIQQSRLQEIRRLRREPGKAEVQDDDCGRSALTAEEKPGGAARMDIGGKIIGLELDLRDIARMANGDGKQTNCHL